MCRHLSSWEWPVILPSPRQWEDEGRGKTNPLLNGNIFICEIGNTRVIKQASLQKFQEEMDKVMKDPYKVVMKQSKLPMSLLHDRIQPHVRWSTVLVVGFCGPALSRYLCLSSAFSGNYETWLSPLPLSVWIESGPGGAVLRDSKWGFATRPEFRSSLIPSSILLPFSMSLNFPAIKRMCLFSCLDTPEAPVYGPVSVQHPANKAKEVIAVRNVICVYACMPSHVLLETGDSLSTTCVPFFAFWGRFFHQPGNY